MLHPCCNRVSPSQAAKCIAICDLIIGLIGMVWLIYSLNGFDYETQERRYYREVEDSHPVRAWLEMVEPQEDTLGISNQNSSKITATDRAEHAIIFVTHEGIIVDDEMANFALSALLTILNLTMCVLLLNAITSKSIPKLKVWMYLRLSLCLIKTVIYVSCVLLGISLETQAPHVFFIVFHIYGLWVVYELIKEIKLQKVTRIEPGIIS